MMNIEFDIEKANVHQMNQMKLELMKFLKQIF